MKKTIYLSIILLLFTACQDYLETNPDSTLDAKIDSEEKIAELLTGAYPEASYFAFLETRTDNVGERVNGIHSRLNEAMYYWEDYDQEDLDTPLNYWNACYAGISQANHALELLSKYPKSDRVKALYGEAFLLRAYLHFMVVNIWAEPYGTSKSETAPGIPYLTKPEKNALVDYKRGTVKEVYDKIEKDLKLGISLVDDSYYSKPKFHFNKKAAYAFASRFYLFKGEWELVIAYSNYILGLDPKLILRNWRQYGKKKYFNRKSLYTLYASTEEPANLLLSTTESRIFRNIPTEKYGVTNKSANKVYNQHGVDGCANFRKVYMAPMFLFNYNDGRIGDGQYIGKFDELSLSGYTGIRPKGLYVTNVLFSTDEVMLNRMEAYAMTGEYDKSINDLLIYLSAKFGITPSCARRDYTQTSSDNYQIYTPFYGMSIKQLAMVKTILGFRQQEFIHEGLRWFDIRRFYISVKRTSKYKFYKRLEKEDPRKLLQIPAEAINRGLEPNPR
mgnify:FL=1